MTQEPLLRALDDVRTGSIVAGLRSADVLARTAAMSSDSPATTDALRRAVERDDDQLCAIAAVHALSARSGARATSLLAELLDDRRWHVTEHAAWALSARPPHRPAMAALAAMVAEGGFAGMLAQRTLEGWATTAGPAVLAVVDEMVDTTVNDGARRRLTETLGLVPGAGPCGRLTVLALDGHEATPTREAAIAALGEHDSDPAVLFDLVDDEVLAEHALLALLDRARRDVDEPLRRPRPGGPLRIAQLFLHADFDAALVRAGAGDNGGIATLLSLLSGALVEHADVAEVITIGRGTPADVLANGLEATMARTDRDDRFVGERIAAVAFGPPNGVDQRGAWPYRVQVERGLRRVLRVADPLDALHLRMADVGTLAASRVARRLGLPVVFTAAPDPHVVLQSLESEHAISRADFGDADALEHHWFRARMVERLTAQADRVALLPRPDMAADLNRLLGYDVAGDGARVVVIPEGVHAATVRRAGADVRASVESGAALPDGPDDLAAAIATQPAGRRSLPSIVTVGRLHPVKGMDCIVQAWATTPALRAAANLVVIGGDLDAPSPDELDVMTVIDEILGGATSGFLMLGHRPHLHVARILSAAAHGAPGIPGGGVYVCAARKEEFGLAIVEALAAGLPVVAPDGGGPATYVRNGVTGVLVDTASVAALADGMQRALSLAAVPGRAETAAHDVLDHLTIEVMADRLVDLYRCLAPVTA